MPRNADQTKQKILRPKPSVSEPSVSAGQNPTTNDKDKLAKLEKEIERLKVQNGILRENFDNKRVQESFKISENDLQEMLMVESMKLQGRVNELVSVLGSSKKMEESLNRSSEYTHIQGLLVEENKHLQQRVQELESASSYNDKVSNTQNESDPQKAAEKTNKTLEDTADKLANIDAIQPDLSSKLSDTETLSKQQQGANAETAKFDAMRSKLSYRDSVIEKIKEQLELATAKTEQRNTNLKKPEKEKSVEKQKADRKESKTPDNVVGAQTTDGNPDIADLSDLNRPTQLAEKYAELYDNEWMDAFEEIEGSGTKEVEVIKRLLDTLKDVYKFCQNASKKYEESIKTSAVVFPGADKGRPKTPQLTATSRKQIVELRKTFAPSLTEDAFNQYIKTLKQPLDNSPKTKLFVKTCVEICWMMNIQDPPAVLDIEDPKGPFDGDKYMTYTRSGNSFDFIVWPPMRLHDAGALLGKGVAQAK